MAFAANNPPGPTPTAPQIARDYGALPLSFERNQGQTESQVRFLSRGAGYSILFKDREAILLLSKRNSSRETPHQPGKREPGSLKTDVLGMRIVGLNPNALFTGEDRLPGTVNYFVGSDPSKWISGVPTFERVKYLNVYPGVDLTYHGNRQRLEFDFDLAPGADARAVRLRFDGAEKMKLDRDGNLIIVAENGQVSFHKPLIYQPGAENEEQTVEGSFRILAGKTVAIRLGRYDHTKPLVIDPILNYSTYLGQSGEAYAIAVDSSGEAYVAGWADAGMPTTPGIQPIPVTKPSPSDTSAYVAKLNSTGTAVVYCTYLSGSGSDAASGIALDPSGNAYVVGTTYSTDFPVTSGAFQTINKAANGAGFVAAINSTGTALVYSTYLSGSTQTWINGIAVDASGDAYVTGKTNNIDFPTTSGAFQASAKADYADDPTGFVAKLSPTGTSLAYSTFLGGTGGDFPAAIALDTADNAYVVGYTQSSDFPTTQGAFQTVRNSEQTGFVTEINAAGGELAYSTYLGGEHSDAAQFIRPILHRRHCQ